MFIQYLRHGCLFFILFAFNPSASADIYKWVDDKGQTHYSQQAPREQTADLIKAPPPPAIDPNVAQQEIDTLIEKQNGTFEAEEEKRLAAEKEAVEKEERDKFCDVENHNLKQYQDNPGRRMIDADGNIIAPDEEQRQQKMIDIQKRITKHCS